MSSFPSRARLAALGEAVHAIVPAAAFGCTRSVDERRSSIFHVYPQGSSEWILSNDAIMHDIEDYHITPEQSAQIANVARVKLLVFYDLLPAPDGWLPRRLFAQGISEARRGQWTLADDGSLYTLPIGSTAIERGSMNE